MGNDCFITSPNQVYKKYLTSINIVQLKSQWKALQIYNIKKIFQNHAQKDLITQKIVISTQTMKQVFSQFSKYDQRQINRIKQIFDFQNTKCLDWNNFYTAITICQKSSHEILAVLMFMIFDQSLAMQLNRDQLNLLADLNSNYIRQSSVDHQAYLYDPDDISEILISAKSQFITIDKWIKQSTKIFDFQRYRNFFNIFIEVKLQRELIQNFQAWNQIFNQVQEKYISYVLDFKWFQLWKTYVSTNYGVKINSGIKNPNTIKTIKSLKTKKTLKTINSIKTERRILTKSIIKTNALQQTFQNSQGDQKIKSKNYNIINGNIGSKPLKMFNQQLQGQFLQVLAPQLVQNMNYVLVSQKVWTKLKYIYQGYPQFRRTGSNNIQLYPKRVKIYSSLLHDKLEYSSLVIREVPCYTRVEDLLQQSIDVQNLKQKQVFYKTIGMNKWEELVDLTYMFTELTSEIMIFLAYFDAQDAQVFRKNHCKCAVTINDVNLGDEILYQTGQKTQQKKAYFMGWRQNGKHIVHFKGTSRIYDEYVQKEDFYKKAKILHRNSSHLQEIKIYPLDIPIIPIVKSFGFINSLILMLLGNSQFKTVLSQYQPSAQNKQILDFLSSLYRQSRKKSRVESNIVADLVELNLTDYINFQFGMIDQCYRSFMQNIDKALRKLDTKNVIRQQYYFSTIKKIKCLHCSDINTFTQKTYCFNIDLSQNAQKYLQFIFVPFSSTLKSLDIKKYGLKIRSNSSFKSYKNQINKLLECQSKSFIICQAYGNDIIRNFSFVKEDATLEELNIKQTDNIVVYQLCTSMSKFVIDHFTQVKDITQKKFKKGQLIDCKVSQQKWMSGKITDVQFKPYTQKTVIKVIHKQSPSNVLKASYEITPQTTAIFPTKSYMYAQQYHLKVLQTCYNQALNQMLPCNMPLVMILTDWMKCKQFQFMVYQQLKIFIAENYRFKDVQSTTEQQNYNQHHNRKNAYSHKQSKQQKIVNFRQYISSANFPYKISILDINGRCLVCHKIHKSRIEKGQSDYYCKGCKLNDQNPISWQIQLKNSMVCIIWQGLDRFKKNIIKDHKSFTEMIMNKKNDVQRLEKLIDEKLSKKVEIVEQLCCNYPYKTLFFEQFKNYPELLVIQIQRLFDNGNNKSIVRKHVHFPFTDLKVGINTYFLTGLICIQGEGNSNITYKNYVSNQNEEWFQIHGQTIKKVKKSVVQKCCALFLIYKKNPNQQPALNKLQDCRQQSDQFIDSQADSNNSRNSPRKKSKQLTINQRLQNMDSDDQDFSYLNTQNSDNIQLNINQQNQNQSDIPPQRSNSKRSVKYIKDSKQLIKSLSECQKNSHSQSRQNLMVIRFDNFKQNNKHCKIINSLRDQSKKVGNSSHEDLQGFVNNNRQIKRIKFQVCQNEDMLMNDNEFKPSDGKLKQQKKQLSERLIKPLREIYPMVDKKKNDVDNNLVKRDQSQQDVDEEENQQKEEKEQDQIRFSYYHDQLQQQYQLISKQQPHQSKSKLFQQYERSYQRQLSSLSQRDCDNKIATIRGINRSSNHNSNNNKIKNITKIQNQLQSQQSQSSSSIDLHISQQ